MNKKSQIKKINHVSKIAKPQGEILGVNKFSVRTTKNIFNFMDNFYKNKRKFLSWENLIDYYIKKTNDSIFILKNQNYSWININTVEDYLEAKTLKIN